jgi:hypothetical protein
VAATPLTPAPLRSTLRAGYAHAVVTASIGSERAAPVQTERRRPSSWAWLVACSTLVLLLAGTLMLVLYLTSEHTRSGSYAVTGVLRRIEVNVGDGNVEILGGGKGPVQVRSSERYAYGHAPHERHAVQGGVLLVEADCPRIVLGRCSVDYRLEVPNNVPVVVHAASGNVQLEAFHGSAELMTSTGDVTADAFCGFSLDATTGTGDISVAATCSPTRLDLRAGTGNVTARVPPNRYRVDATTHTGDVDVSGIVRADDASFEILALSDTGDVKVEATP